MSILLGVSLIREKKSDVKLPNDRILDLHNQIRDMLDNMCEKDAKKFVDKINKEFTIKYGEKWVKFKL